MQKVKKYRGLSEAMDMVSASEKLVQDILRKGYIEEKQMNLLKNRLNSGKISTDVVQPLFADGGIEVDSKQAIKAGNGCGVNTCLRQ